MPLLWTVLTAVLLSLLNKSFSEELVPEDALYKFLKYTSGNGAVKFSGGSGEPLILTKYIEEGKLKEARDLARVDNKNFLPGVDSYAGYLTVNKKYNANLFVWYFPVSGQPVDETPWIIWLQGGLGMSSLYGLFNEIGPYVVKDGKVQEQKYSWAKNHSLLFIDSPVGTGFSFQDDRFGRGFATNQTTIGKNLYSVLQQFLTIFSELRKAPLTIAGESYAGKHIPSLAIQIHRNRGKDAAINLKSLAIGNGFIDPVSLQRYSYFVREVGLLSDHQADEIRKTEMEVVREINAGNMMKAAQIFGQVLGLIVSYSGCSPFNYLKDWSEYNFAGEYVDFLNRSDVREAIHVGNKPYSPSNIQVINFINDYMNSTKSWLEELIGSYKVMCYNGHLDIVVAYHPSVHTYESLKFPGSEGLNTSARHVWHHEGRVAGYFRGVGNFSDVMVKEAGHMVPLEQPSAALGMITAFVRNISLLDDTGYLVN